MFKPRKIASLPALTDSDGIKLYTVSAGGADVDHNVYLPRLEHLKLRQSLDWGATAAFAIFHDGVNAQYLVLARWGNENELFTTVSVRLDDGWIEDPDRYSFCVWDLEIFWAERNFFIEHVYQPRPQLAAYRQARLRC